MSSIKNSHLCWLFLQTPLGIILWVYYKSFVFQNFLVQESTRTFSIPFISSYVCGIWACDSGQGGSHSWAGCYPVCLNALRGPFTGSGTTTIFYTILTVPVLGTPLPASTWRKGSSEQRWNKLPVCSLEDLRTTGSCGLPVILTVSVVWKEAGRERRTGRPQRSMRNIWSCPSWRWHMDPHEYWPFSSGFQHIFETSGDSLALICCWHPAVHVFCNRCALQMSTDWTEVDADQQPATLRSRGRGCW